jgi:multidrug efflux pump subunit AcrA (membrane-fusion protein)
VWVWAVVALAAALGLAGLVLWGAGTGSDRAELKLGADLAEAKPVAFDISVTAVGELEAKTQIELRNELDRETTITQIVPEGAAVKAGDVIVTLNADEIQREIDEEQMRLESAKADQVAAGNALDIQQSENDSKLRQAGLKLALAELAYQEWKQGDVATKRENLRIALEKAEREAARLAERVENSRALHQREFLSKDELERDRTALLEADAALVTARLARDTYENFQHPKEEKTRSSDVEEAKAELDRVEKTNASQLTSKQAALTNTRNQLTSRENKLQKLRKQHASATIQAPSDGLVVYTTSLRRWRWMGKSWSVGSKLYPGQEVVVLPDTSSMIATVRVHEALAGQIKQGQPASIKLDALGGRTLAGTVESVGVMAQSDDWIDENKREYTVRILLTEQIPGLKPSMRAEATILIEKVPEVLTVPIQAVFMDAPVRFVHADRGDRGLERLPVRLGRRSDTLAEIKVGLAAGDRILIRAPKPGEVATLPWPDQLLVAAGYEKDPKGQIVDAEALRLQAPITSATDQNATAAAATTASALNTPAAPTPAATETPAPTAAPAVPAPTPAASDTASPAAAGGG